MKVGDSLIFEDGSREKIISFHHVDGAAMVMTKDPNCKLDLTSLKYRSYIEKFVSSGIWKLEPKGQRRRKRRVRL